MSATPTIAQHSPGPWELITKSEDGSIWPHGVRAADGTWVVRNGWDDDFGNDQFANAYLVAGAYGLLSALELCRDEFGSFLRLDKTIYAEVLDAIAKARGTAVTP